MENGVTDRLDEKEMVVAEALLFRLIPAALNKIHISLLALVMLFLVFSEVCNWIFLHVQVDNRCVGGKKLRSSFHRHLVIFVDQCFPVWMKILNFAIVLKQEETYLTSACPLIFFIVIMIEQSKAVDPIL